MKEKNKMKKVLALLFVAAMLVGCMAPAISAQEDPSATAISTVAEFEAMTDGNYYLANDIDFEGKSYTNYVVEAFSGTLDGNGKTIKNIAISASADAGVFQTLAVNSDTTIKDLTLEGITITCTTEGLTIGVLAGYDYSATNLLTLENVEVNGTFTGKARALGGLLGASLYCDIKNCRTYGSFTLEDTGAAKPRHIGGLIGETKEGITNIYGSANYADLSIPTAAGYKAYMCLAGFVGVAGLREAATEQTNIYNCVNFGDIYNANNNRNQHNAAGFIGLAIGKGESVISGCANFGNISGGYRAAGIIAWNAYQPYTINDCVIYGTVTAGGAGGTGTYVALNQATTNINSACLDKTGTVFAAGTSDDIAVFGVQESTPASDKFNVRVSATLKNTANYSNVGFEITTYVMSGEEYVVKTPTKECSAVFSKLIGSSELGITEEYSASSVGADHLFALTLKNIPVADGDSVLVIVRPYAVSGAETVYGNYAAALWSAGNFVAIGNLA